MAVITLSGWSMRCFRRCPPGWPNNQQNRLSLDNLARSLLDERHDIYHFLRECCHMPLRQNALANTTKADSLEVMVIAQAFSGVPWGFFIANSPAYASEIVPLSLRSACAATLQMSWAIGSIIVAGISYAFNQRDDQWSWRLPAALQWIFPVSNQNLVNTSVY